MSDNHSWDRAWPWLRAVLIFAICFAVGALAYSTIQEIRLSRTAGTLTPEYHASDLWRRLHSHTTPANPDDPSTIKDWMTFDYVNRVFKLPNNQLQNALMIQDKRYPRLSIRNFALSTKQKSPDVLLQIQSDVRNFATTSTPAMTTSTTP